jgi:hypothetical protein
MEHAESAARFVTRALTSISTVCQINCPGFLSHRQPAFDRFWPLTIRRPVGHEHRRLRITIHCSRTEVPRLTLRSGLHRFFQQQKVTNDLDRIRAHDGMSDDGCGEALMALEFECPRTGTINEVARLSSGSLFSMALSMISASVNASRLPSTATLDPHLSGANHFHLFSFREIPQNRRRERSLAQGKDVGRISPSCPGASLTCPVTITLPPGFRATVLKNR